MGEPLSIAPEPPAPAMELSLPIPAPVVAWPSPLQEAAQWGGPELGLWVQIWALPGISGVLWGKSYKRSARQFLYL